MATGRRTWAYPATALGSVGLAISLWLPWYSFRLPGALIDQAVQLSQQWGALGPIVRQGAEIARNLGPIHLSAWQVFQQVDIMLAIAAAAAGGLSLLTYSGRATGVERVITSAAVTALLTGAYRVLSPPGPGGFLHPAWGSYFALLCAGTMAFGAFAATGAATRPQPVIAAVAATDVPPSWETARSIAPPTG